MDDVTIFTSNFCSFCVRAKRLLENRGVPYREVDITGNSARREEMVAESGRRTVPQIFIKGQPIGGFHELQALDSSGELDTLLAQN